MFIEKRPTYPLQSRRDDMFMLLSNVTHFVPTGLKRGCSILIYKHIVPTGLRSLLYWIFLLKLTPIVRHPYRTYRPVYITEIMPKV